MLSAAVLLSAKVNYGRLIILDAPRGVKEKALCDKGLAGLSVPGAGALSPLRALW